jgi:hypothetical protein
MDRFATIAIRECSKSAEKVREVPERGGKVPGKERIVEESGEVIAGG